MMKYIASNERPGRGGRSRGRHSGDVQWIHAGTGVQVKTLVTMEAEGTDKPACVSESRARWFG
jgi:hypothetical protein